MVTVEIIDPPVRNGGSASSSSGPRPHHADARGPQHLVAAEHRHVDPERGQVDRQVRDRLAGVEHDERADRPGPGDELGDRVEGAEHVGGVAEGQHPGALGQLDAVQVEPAVVGDAVPAEPRPGPAAQLLPRHEVGVVLHLGDDDLVAGAEREVLRARRGRGVAEGVRHQVDALGRVLRQDDLVRRGPHEGRDPRPCTLVGLGRLLRELVGPPVDRGVARGEEPPLCVQDVQGALRRGGGVQVHQPLPVADGPGQDGEVLDQVAAGCSAHTATVRPLRPVAVP
jgi:hypothetical protein